MLSMREVAMDNPAPLAKRRLSKMHRNASQPTGLYTLTTSSLGIDTSSQPHSSTSTITNSDILSPQTFYDARSGQESRVQLRNHLFRDQEDTASSPIELLEDNGLERLPSSQPVGGFKQKMARTSTMITRRASMHLPGLSKPPSRLSITEGAETTDAMISEIKAKAITDSNNALNHDSQPYDNKPPRAPIRRRSLFTPGLATRNPENPLRKLSAYMADQKPVAGEPELDPAAYYYNSELSEISPLGRIAALDLAAGRCESPLLRSVTPSERDFGVLGAGLRITNGMASPNPSSRSVFIGSRNTTPRPTHKDSFYTAAEGSIASDELRPPPDFLIARKQTSSPLRVAQSIDSFASAYTMTQTQVDGTGALKPRKPNRSSLLALEYMCDLPDSPFVSLVDLNKPLPFAPTTKANEFEDELFEDGASTPSPVSDRSIVQWKELMNEDNKLAEITKQYGDDSIAFVGNLASEVSVQQQHTITQTRIATRNESRRSLRSTWTTSSSKNGSTTTTVTTTAVPVVSTTKMRPRLSVLQNVEPEKRPNISPADSGYYSSTSSQDAHRQLSYQKLIGVSKPNVEAKDAEYNISTVSSDSLRTRTDSSRPSRSSMRERSRSSQPQPQPREAPEPQPAIQRVQTLPQIQTTENMVEVSRKKLQKKSRPKSMPPPLDRNVFPRDREVSGSDIPPVPTAVAERHAERTREFPPLQFTVPNLTHARSSRDFRSPAPVSEPLKFPSPAPPRNERRTSRRLFSGRLGFAAEPLDEDYTGTVQSAPIRPSRSERRNSRQVTALHKDEVAMLTDFGDVAQYLGGTPYDIASATRSTGYGPKRDTRLQPHHMTNAMPKSKSMVGMNDAEAAEVNRLRASYRAVGMSEQPRRALASPELSAPPASATLEVYLPGRLDDHDRHWQSRRPTAEPQRMHTVPVVEKVRHYEQRGQQSQFEYTEGLPKFGAKSNWAEHTASWAQRRQQADDSLSGERRYPVHSMPHQVQDVAYIVETDGRGNTGMRRAPVAKPTLPPKEVGAQEGIVARMSGRFEGGRFEGGFAYGYEPGCGFNGSAGTRGPRSGASRKSVQMGQQYGIDLTDVPVFVTPTIST